MNLRDAETGKVLWQGIEDLSVPGVEHEGLFTMSISYSHINLVLMLRLETWLSKALTQ